jgi:hypothetical protein
MMVVLVMGTLVTMKALIMNSIFNLFLLLPLHTYLRFLYLHFLLGVLEVSV